MSYRARPRHPLTGARFWVRGATERELAAYLHRIDSLRTELKLGLVSADDVDQALRNLRHGPVTVERAARSYAERARLAPSTRRRVTALLRTYLAPLAKKPLAALDVPTMSRWIDDLGRRGLADTSIDCQWRRVRAIAAHAQERGWLGALPWGEWKPRLSKVSTKEPRDAARTLAELAAVLESARRIDARDAKRARCAWLEAKIACAAMLGLRQGEIAGLRWGDLDATPGRVRVLVARQWDGQPLKRGTAPAWIAAPDELAEILEQHRSACYGGAPRDWRSLPIFPHPRSLAEGKPRHYASGEPLSSLNVRRVIAGANFAPGGTWSAHSFRDTFVTLETLQRGGDLRAVADRSRHRSVASLARYLRALVRTHPPAAPHGLPANAAGGLLLVGPTVNPHTSDEPNRP